MGELPSKIGLYRIVRQLGEGGMGTVFEAVHDQIERRVAIKVIRPDYARDAEFTARFFNEARVVNRVGHPGLVQISDYGRLSDGTAYIVMEFLEGKTLAERLAQLGGKLPLPEAIQLGWQLADSLAAAHDKGIVHRDLKPENVMIVPDPYMASGERTKLLDFGIAKVAELGTPGPAQGAKTQANQVMGTPVYMSPEQCSGAAGVDGKSDVYSLGVMLFEMLAGRPPFVAETPAQIMGMHMFVAPPLLRELAPELPQPLSELVHRMLAKNTEARLTMRQMAATLERLSDQNPPPKRSASNEAIRADEIEYPDTTILVGQKTPSALDEAPAMPIPTAQTVRSGPRLRRWAMALGGALSVAGRVILRALPLTRTRPMADGSARIQPHFRELNQDPPWQMGRWQLHRRQRVAAVGLAGVLVTACILWLSLRPHAPKPPEPLVSPVKAEPSSTPSENTASTAAKGPPQAKGDQSPVKTPNAPLTPRHNPPDASPPTPGPSVSGPTGKPAEGMRGPNNPIPFKKNRESEKEKSARAMLDFGKDACKQRNVDKAN